MPHACSGTVEIATDTRTDRNAGFIIVFDRECHPVIAEKRKIWALLAPALPWRVKAGHPHSILLIEILDDQYPIELAMRCPPIRFQPIIGDKGIQVV